MTDLIRLWFRVAYETLKVAIDGINRFVHRLHEEARTHENPKDPDQYDPERAEKLRKQANEYARAAEELRKATEAAIKDQPGDNGSKK